MSNANTLAVAPEPEKTAETPPSTFTPINGEDMKVSTELVPAEGAETAIDPTTPKKTAKPKKAANPKTPKEPKEPKTTKKSTPAKRTTDGEETPKSGKRAKTSTPAGNRSKIPTCEAELSEADKMMLEWKEAGRTWKDINKEYERLGGQAVAGSTLPNRIMRVKSALANLEDDHVDQFKASVTAVDAAIEADIKEIMSKKWKRVAEHMKENGVEKTYLEGTLQKYWSKNCGAAKSSSPERADSGAEVVDEETGAEADPDVAVEEME